MHLFQFFSIYSCSNPLVPNFNFILVPIWQYLHLFKPFTFTLVQILFKFLSIYTNIVFFNIYSNFSPFILIKFSKLTLLLIIHINTFLIFKNICTSSNFYTDAYSMFSHLHLFNFHTYTFSIFVHVHMFKFFTLTLVQIFHI